jgi:hypothetical protein
LYQAAMTAELLSLTVALLQPQLAMKLPALSWAWRLERDAGSE